MNQRKLSMTRIDARLPLSSEAPPKSATQRSRQPRPCYQDVHGLPLRFTAFERKA